MADIQVSSAGIISVLTNETDIYASSLGIMAVYNNVSEEVDATSLGIVSVLAHTVSLDVSSLSIMSVIRGRVENPKLRSWGFTLDGHDFFVLRLGYAGKTLVYDVSTGQWSWWQDGGADSWRIQTGLRFGANKTGDEYRVSDVVVGDDTLGVLYRLDPDLGVDAKITDPANDTLRFERIATGQIATRDRNFIPIYGVSLAASAGQPLEDGDEVEHLYSDDLGNTYVTAGTVSVTEGDYNQDFDWRSLGLAIPAGRLFRIVDDGALMRIDSLDVSHGGKDA